MEVALECSNWETYFLETALDIFLSIKLKALFICIILFVVAVLVVLVVVVVRAVVFLFVLFICGECGAGAGGADGGIFICVIYLW